MGDKRALIIDDDNANRALWELVLNERGYDVSFAADAASGISQIADDISLYLVDYHLPDRHGTDIILRIRDFSATSIVVMVSMDDDADVIREALRAGGNVFMVKPATPAVMGQLLSEIEAGTINASARQLINRHGRRSYSLPPG